MSARLIGSSGTPAGSPMPKSMMRTPSSALRRFASSRSTNGYVGWSARTGESGTAAGYALANACRAPERAHELRDLDLLVAVCA